MKVYVPGPLRSYTGEKSVVEGRGATVQELLAGMDTDYPGMRFRMIDERGKIREHIKIFVNGEQVREVNITLDARDEVHIICAISGGAVDAK